MPSQWYLFLALGHGQSAQRFRPKARYIEKAFRAFANGRDVSFSFQYLSGILPAYPDKIDNTDQWVWGYGDPEDDEIKKMELSIKHILDTLDREDDGPFAGIVGFSSGGAMAAVVASLLEKGGRINDLSLKASRLGGSFPYNSRTAILTIQNPKDTPS